MIIASTYPSASISTEQLLARRAEITSVVATLILKDTNHTTTGTTSLPQFCHFVLTTMQHSFGVPVPDTRGKENVARLGRIFGVNGSVGTTIAAFGRTSLAFV